MDSEPVPSCSNSHQELNSLTRITNRQLTDSQSLFDLISSYQSNRDSSPSALKKLVDTLSKISTKLAVSLASDDGHGDILEDRLDPRLDGIFYFFILITRLEFGQTSGNDQRLISQVERFCSNVPKNHVLTLSQHLLKFVQLLSYWTSKRDQLSRSLKPIADLIKSYMPPEVLTPLHAQLMKNSLRSRSIEHALEISSHDILLVDQKECPLKYQDHLAYHYLAGTIHALSKNYTRAIHLLTIVVSAPGNSISQFQFDAYKKLILISALSNSKPPTLPRYTNPQFRSVFKNFNGGKPYIELIDLYENHETVNNPYEKLCQIAEQNMHVFKQDKNSGLIKMCVAMSPRKMVLGLIPIYSSLPLSKLDSLLPNLPKGSGRELVEEMVKSGELEAEIREEHLRFLEKKEIQPTQLTAELQTAIHRAKNTGKILGSICDEIEGDRDYLSRLVSDLKELEKPFPESSRPGAVGLGGFELGEGGLAERSFTGIIEEDLAADISSKTWDDQSSFR
ncbi:hypothetical protein PPACK8108_LOCUS628 [Phakopsora pachyrhizi]|uniref:COP9 signalosome complex subunit 3 N-terminal helical repeats domain-containing protein n=1 Tax=Phakopsora pachyrhizi TaxID=170000 RepID=A0AAV0ADZ1_PHAPC|nr:hypothetical protein PPACK8108_LOCUS628 [Phakopsora pachyrhizi]